jgi:hypothetical protein
MRAVIRSLTLAVCAVGLLVLPAAASADHATRPTEGLEALGHAPNPGIYNNDGANSDLAFWGNRTFNGSYQGFRIIDHSNPESPQEIINYKDCSPLVPGSGTPPAPGNQGDVAVWGNILVRSWNSPAPMGATCDGRPVSFHWEGLHIFDISNPQDPNRIADIELPCGSHTVTMVPDLANNRLILYNQTSGGPCYFFDIIEVPLANPAGSRLLRQQEIEGEHACHDSSVILGDVNMMACAAGHMTNVFDIGKNRWPGGTLTKPKFLYTVEEEGVGPIPGSTDPHSGSWHSAAFTWDGEVLILGWEPGGGGQAECQADSPVVRKTMFFYNAKNGKPIGHWTLPRPQTAAENCTIHNYNILPLKGRHIVTSGNYQAGTWVTDFTDPENPEVLAYSDPPPLSPTLQIGGAWSSYWYNGLIFESEITKGLNIFKLDDSERDLARILRKTKRLDHLNPQTEEFSLPSRGWDWDD